MSYPICLFSHDKQASLSASNDSLSESKVGGNFSLSFFVSMAVMRLFDINDSFIAF